MRLLWCLVLIACSTAEEPTPPEPVVASGIVQTRIPIAINRRIDVLFVIDSSPAMAPYADRLHTNLARFIDGLRTPTIPSVRLAVTTTDDCTNDAGAFRGAPTMTGDFLVDFVGDDGTRQRNYDGDIAALFAHMTDVGTSGCAQPQPLVAVRRAFERHRSFMRRDAYTAIFFITASDTPEDAIGIYNAEQFLKSLQPDWQRLLFGAVLGATGPDARLPMLFKPWADRSAQVSIDSDDWSPVWQILRPLFKTSLGAPCVEGPLLDIDPERPERQYGCAFWYEFPIGGEVIPSCDDVSDVQCWRIKPEPQFCPSSEGLIEIEHARVDFPEEVFLNAECLTR